MTDAITGPQKPLSTYRLQFNKDFRFADATRLLDYFSQLGITDLYASPILVSRRGSGHGYDVTDTTRIDPEIGSEEEFEELQRELQKRGMGLLLDIVPNHMAASSENRKWMDVLANGPDSAFASYFDIDWHPPMRSLDEKVLLPVLGKSFGEVLESGELQLQFEDSKFFIQYFDQRFPVSPASYGQILNLRTDELKEALADRTAVYQEYLGIATGLAALAQQDRHRAQAERRLAFDSLIERLRALLRDNAQVEDFIRVSVTRFNGIAGDPASFSLLERLLDQQHFLLADWQDPNQGINYRRFFAISELVGIRVEDPVVFEATHDQMLRVIAKSASIGLRVGLRIDHIDGLRDPGGYLAKLQQRVANLFPADSPNMYVIVEKILGRGEIMPTEWPVAGTTGYEYLNAANDLFVYKPGAERLMLLYSSYAGGRPPFADIVYNKKKLVMDSLLRVEMRSLGRRLADLAAKDRYARSVLRAELLNALIEVTACLPVYRTYIHTLELPRAAQEYIHAAMAQARRHAPYVDPKAFDFLQEVLTLSDAPQILPDQREARLAFVTRWQQVSGPIMAKGFEDTALYVYYPLSSMNEVGGDPQPEHIGSREDFFRFVTERQARWPHTLNASSTHDTKRSEGVRARINVLSEIPEEWASHLDAWTKGNARHKQVVNGKAIPDANEEYLIYQTLVGMWPLASGDLDSIKKRLQEYVIKALREANVHTRWTRPNEFHERAVIQFIELIVREDKANCFLKSVSAFENKVAWCGMMNGMGQTLLKITCPGVPDFYQGTELWDFHLVDPDNRNIVDYGVRQEACDAIGGPETGDDGAATAELWKTWRDGRIKLYLARKALSYRREQSEIFADGDFVPLRVTGMRGEHVIAFLRRSQEHQAMTVVPRWMARAYTNDGRLPDENFWGDTRLSLPAGNASCWRSVFTGRSISCNGNGGEIAISELLADFPEGLFSSS